MPTRPVTNRPIVETPERTLRKPVRSAPESHAARSLRIGRVNLLHKPAWSMASTGRRCRTESSPEPPAVGCRSARDSDAPDSEALEPTNAPLVLMTPSSRRPAVVLLSGGLDSATSLAIAKSEGFEPHAMTFRYGQRHEAEIAAARRVAAYAGVDRHLIVDIDLRTFGGSSLTTDTPVPKGRDLSSETVGIPSTYVPARNTVFLSFALAWAEVLGSQDIFIGVNAVDYSGYPDCRPEYIAAYQAMANLATREGVEGRSRLTIHAPLIQLTKAQIIARGIALGVDYAITSTCYDPSPAGAACGECDACQIRLKGFATNGMRDPAPYVEGVPR